MYEVVIKPARVRVRHEEDLFSFRVWNTEWSDKKYYHYGNLAVPMSDIRDVVWTYFGDVQVYTMKELAEMRGMSEEEFWIASPTSGSLVEFAKKEVVIMEKSIVKLFSIELIENNKEDSIEVFYRVNGVDISGGTANVGRSAGSYVSENLLGAHEDARDGLASLVGGVQGHADPGFCATHRGMDFLSWEAYMKERSLNGVGIMALLREQEEG